MPLLGMGNGFMTATVKVRNLHRCICRWAGLLMRLETSLFRTQTTTESAGLTGIVNVSRQL